MTGEAFAAVVVTSVLFVYALALVSNGYDRWRDR